VTDRWIRVEVVDAVRVIRYGLVAAAMDAGVAHHATGAEQSRGRDADATTKPAR